MTARTVRTVRGFVSSAKTGAAVSPLSGFAGPERYWKRSPWSSWVRKAYTGVVARNLGEFLWLLAGGYGPFEAAVRVEPGWEPRGRPEIASIAERHAPGQRLSPEQVIDAARLEFPGFDEAMMALCPVMRDL